MNLPDLINGTFEAIGGWMTVLNIIQLLKDKKVRGIHWGASHLLHQLGFMELLLLPTS